MNIQELRAQVRAGNIDTVIVLFLILLAGWWANDFERQFFLDSVLKHGTHGCTIF